jgi:hypothetical protein
MIFLNELANLGCYFRAFEAHLCDCQRIVLIAVTNCAHHEQLTKSPMNNVSST